MMWLWMSLFVAAVAASPTHTRKRYDGYQLWEMVPNTKQQFHVLNELTDSLDLDFWMEGGVGMTWQVLVGPSHVAWLEADLQKAGMSHTVIRENVQDQLDAEWARLDARPSRTYDPDDYNTLQDIWDEMDAMVLRCPAHLGVICDTYVMGYSTEGRPQKVLTIHKEGTADDRAMWWMEATIHAREWLATTSNLRILDIMTKDYETDTDVQHMIDHYDWHFLPVVNPDGYEFTWTDDRYWRKSRNVNEGSECMGVDLNRNFDDHWGNSGTSQNPCSDNYLGTHPASEPEVANCQDEAQKYKDRLVNWVSMHTQGQMWLHPWGWREGVGPNSCAFSDDHDDLYYVAEKTAEASMAKHNTVWTYGNSCDTIYPASGITPDYIKGQAGVKYAYTPELRGPGHDPPASEIEPGYEETWEGIKAMVYAIEDIEGIPE